MRPLMRSVNLKGDVCAGVKGDVCAGVKGRPRIATGLTRPNPNTVQLGRTEEDGRGRCADRECSCVVPRTDVWPFPAIVIPAGTMAAADS